jgi:hypothetical protein
MESCPHIKHGVYCKSNAACNTPINFLFSLLGVAEKNEIRPIDRALEIARRRGMNQSDFARRMDVLPQDITNWKSRGMPPEHYERAATVLHCTVDELLGRSKLRANGAPLEPWMVEYLELDVEQQNEIREIVEDRIARFRAKSAGLKRSRKSRS